MRLGDAISLSDNWTAQLVSRDVKDPCYFGTNTDFGVLYMWTMGHTVPRMKTGFTSETPPVAGQEDCVCGEAHGFPKDSRELLWHLQLDQRWKPCFEISVLDALIREPPEETDG
jgi:hypothetical protein